MATSLNPAALPVQEQAEAWRVKYVKAVEQHSRDVDQLEYMRGVLEAERMRLALLKRERLELSAAVLFLTFILMLVLGWQGCGGLS